MLQVHSSLALSPLQSSFALFSRPTSFDVEALPTLGLAPLRDITKKRPLCEEFHFPTVPSSGFHNLSTAFSAIQLAGLFHPTATYRVVLFRGFSLRAAVSLIERTMPPCRLTDVDYQPRLAATPSASNFEASIHTKQRC
jgi:hypothetical protein